MSIHWYIRKGHNDQDEARSLELHRLIAQTYMMKTWYWEVFLQDLYEIQSHREVGETLRKIFCLMFHPPNSHRSWG